jgi:arsenite methyltransferase
MSLLLDVLVPQLARPHGALGHLVASALNRANHGINLHVVGALDLVRGDRVLELGFGGGVGLAMVLSHEPGVQLSGVDISPEMLARCERRFGAQVQLARAGVEALPQGDSSVDKLFGVNVSYFWPDMRRALAELERVLVPGGLLVLGIRPPETLRRFQFDRAGHRVWTPAEYVQALTEAGFQRAHARRMPDPDGAYLLCARAA